MNLAINASASFAAACWSAGFGIASDDAGDVGGSGGAAVSSAVGPDFAERRDARALFFSNSMWPGKQQIRYLARVRATGTATAPPAKIEEMYHPDRFGLSASLVVKGKALK